MYTASTNQEEFRGTLHECLDFKEKYENCNPDTFVVIETNNMPFTDPTDEEFNE